MALASSMPACRQIIGSVWAGQNLKPAFNNLTRCALLRCIGLSNHVVNTTCCSSHSQLTHSASCRYLTSRDTGSVANTKRYVTADNGFSGPLVNGTERCPVFGKIRCPIFCTLKDSNPGGYPEAALPSSSFTATLSIPALRLVLSR